MPSPHAVVIPFGVPSEGRGLGIGLAALVHVCAHLEGAGVAIAQLHGRRKDEPEGAAASPVEAFVPPSAWPQIAGEARGGIGVVVTGAFEPPGEGEGTIQLLVFDAKDGHTRSRVDAPFDADGAGAAVVEALERLWSPLGGGIGALQGLRDLAWEPLESVLRAERCALHDPLRGGPHDRLAAMLHLGRAIGDDPKARYPIMRLAGLALETANAPAFDPKLASATVRALARAVEDAPDQVELVEALAALELRLGQPRQAERRLNAALAAGMRRARVFVLLAQALRAQGLADGALAAVQAGLDEGPDVDGGLHLERGMALAAKSDFDGAAVAWRVSLDRDPVQPGAFVNLGAFALRQGDAATAEILVDNALAAAQVHPDVLRRAVQLALAVEREGLPRASRLASLCKRLLEANPGDAGASLTLARSLVVLGDPEGALARLVEVDRLAPGSAASAEAQVVRLAVENPSVDVELRSVCRAAESVAPGELGEVAARARRVATLHGAWPGWLAAGIAERRQARWVAARAALEVAVELAPGAVAAHLELVPVLLALEEAPRAAEHAGKALALEGETARAVTAAVRSLLAAGRTQEALRLGARGLAQRPSLADAEELKAVLAAHPAAPRTVGGGAFARLRSAWNRLRGRPTTP